MIKGYLKIVRKINTLFVTIVLFSIYFPVVGLCFCMYKILSVNKTTKNKNTYWKKPSFEKLDKKYFHSAY